MRAHAESQALLRPLTPTRCLSCFTLLILTTVVCQEQDVRLFLSIQASTSTVSLSVVQDHDLGLVLNQLGIILRSAVASDSSIRSLGGGGGA